MIQKPKSLALALIACGTLFLSNASAITQVTMGVFDAGSSGHYRANPNEELDWVLSNYALGKSTDGEWFGTFCIERNEYFQPGHTYDVALNDGAMSGGENGAVNGKDIISVGTAWLYEQFALGTLSGFVYGNLTHAQQLQNAIWQLEGEYSGPNDFGAYLGLAQSLPNYSDNYDGSAVKVMNLTRNNGQSQFQDQLVYVPQVPDAGSTIGLLLAGIIGLAVTRRRLNAIR